MSITPSTPLREIYQQISRSDEYNLILACRAGDKAAKNRLARLLMPRISLWIQCHPQWITGSTPADELEQVAWTWLDRALEKFEYDRGFRFWTYFKCWAFKAIQSFIDHMFNRTSKKNYKPWYSLDLMSESGDSLDFASASDVFEDCASDLMEHRYLSAIIESLSLYSREVREIGILRLIDGLTWKAVAEVIGLSVAQCMSRFKKIRLEFKANIEYILGRPLSLQEIGAVLPNDPPAPEPIPAPVEPIPAPVESIPTPVELIPAPVEPIPTPVEPVPSHSVAPGPPITPSIASVAASVAASIAATLASPSPEPSVAPIPPSSSPLSLLRLTVAPAFTLFVPLRIASPLLQLVFIPLLYLFSRLELDTPTPSFVNPLTWLHCHGLKFIRHLARGHPPHPLSSATDI